MIDEIGVQTGSRILEWGAPGIVVILMLGLIVAMYRHFAKQIDYWRDELSRERAAHEQTRAAQIQDIRNLAIAGEAFRQTSERYSAFMEASAHWLDRGKE